jgi:uncharacterized membrane protein YidH (DUF202 family)
MSVEDWLMRTADTLRWGTVPDWFVAVFTLLLAMVAVFQDRLRALVQRPKLRRRMKNARPDCVFYPVVDAQGRQVGARLNVRLWIKNRGKASAQNVEVYAHAVWRARGTGQWEPVTEFIPMNLVWSDLDPNTMYFPLIAPLMGKHCNLGYVQADPQDASKAVFTFSTILQPSNRANTLPAGRYRVALRVAAANGKPWRTQVEFELRGRWYDDEARMLAEEFLIRRPARGVIAGGAALPEDPELQRRRAIEAFKSLPAIALSGLKLLALLNGGAAVAILAYLGNVSKSGGPVPRMVWPMALYVLGLFLCGVAFLLAYRTQFLVWNEAKGAIRERSHMSALVWTQVAAVASLVAFVVGSLWAAVLLGAGC